jgi:hypothetical protein
LGSGTTGRETDFPTVLFEQEERIIAPKAPVAETLRNSLLECVVFIVMFLNIYK